jgi:hypothetical protein
MNNTRNSIKWDMGNDSVTTVFGGQRGAPRVSGENPARAA